MRVSVIMLTCIELCSEIRLFVNVVLFYFSDHCCSINVSIAVFCPSLVVMCDTYRHDVALLLLLQCISHGISAPPWTHPSDHPRLLQKMSICMQLSVNTGTVEVELIVEAEK